MAQEFHDGHEIIHLGMPNELLGQMQSDANRCRRERDLRVCVVRVLEKPGAFLTCNQRQQLLDLAQQTLRKTKQFLVKGHTGTNEQTRQK